MIDAVIALLQGDAVLNAALPGGVHNAIEISRQATPGAYDANGELQPSALVRQETATPWGPHNDSGRLYFAVYFYDRASHTAIETARKRVYVLLHRQKLTPTDGSGNYEIVHASDLLDMEEASLGAALAISRYVATVQRG